MNIFNLIKWWWMENSDYLKIHDPWVFPVIAILFPTSIFIKSLPSLVYVIKFFITLGKKDNNDKK